MMMMVILMKHSIHILDGTHLKCNHVHNTHVAAFLCSLVGVENIYKIQDVLLA